MTYEVHGGELMAVLRQAGDGGIGYVSLYTTPPLRFFRFIRTV